MRSGGDEIPTSGDLVQIQPSPWNGSGAAESPQAAPWEFGISMRDNQDRDRAICAVNLWI